MVVHDGEKVKPITAVWQPKYSMVASRSRRQAAFGYKRQKMEKKKPLLKQKFRTTSAHIKDLLDAFIIHYPIKGTVLETLEIKEEKIGNHFVRFQLILDYFNNDWLGWIGTVASEPNNEYETWIRVFLTSDSSFFMEKEEEIKTEAWKFLQAFIKHLQNRISDIQPGPIIPTTEEVEEGLTVSGEPEPANKSNAIVSERTAALNHLAVLWVEYNQHDRVAKIDDMAWFLGEYTPRDGLPFVSTDEFKKHLPKARKAGIIDQDKKTKRFIPKLAT
jgi:hypothetical protein